MNDLPRQKLRELIARHGSIVCTEPQRCEKLLQEACPRESRAVNLLMSGLKALVAVDLRDASPAVPILKTIGKLTKRLEGEEGLSPELAKWVVESWALALRKVSEAELAGKAPSHPDESRLKAFEYSKDGIILPPKKKSGDAGAVPVSVSDLADDQAKLEGAAPEARASALEAPAAESAEAKTGAANEAVTANPANAAVAPKPQVAAPAAAPEKPVTRPDPGAPDAGKDPGSKAVQPAGGTKPGPPKPAAPAQPGKPVPVHEVEMPLVHPAPSPLAPVPHAPRRGALGLILLLLFGLIAGVTAWWYFFREVVRESEEIVNEKKKRRRRRGAAN